MREQTVIDVCEALGIDLRGPPGPVPGVAGEACGAYTRGFAEPYVGLFGACRRSFHRPDALLRTLFELAWSDEMGCLTFREHQRYKLGERLLDNSQSGLVHISPVTDLVHLVTMDRGAVRLVTLTKMRLSEQVMRGAVLTQSERLMFFRPAVSAVVLRKLSAPRLDEAALALVGPIEPGHPDHAAAVAELELVEREAVLIADGRGA